MPSFADIANKKANEVEKPPLAPVGDYIMQVTGDATFNTIESPKGKWDAVNIPCQGVSALETVDVKDLEDFGGAKGLRVRHSFMFNKDPEEEAAFKQTEYQLKNFLVEILQIEGGEKKTLAQLLSEAKGHQFRATIGHRPDPNKPDTIYAEIKSAAAIE